MWRLNVNTTKAIKHTHYFTMIISLFVGFMYSKYNIGLAGLWTTRVFIILALLTGIFFNFLANKNAINNFEKYYFKIFSFFPTFIGVILCIPFLGVITVVSIFGILISPANKIHFEDKQLRILTPTSGVLARPSNIEIFEKNWFYDKKIYTANHHEYGFDSVIISYDNDSTRIFFYDTYGELNEPKKIVIEKIK